jgi:hypothetical protein
VVGGRQLRETLARGLLIPGADGAVKPTFSGLIAFVTNLPVPALNGSCGNRETFVGFEVLTAVVLTSSRLESTESHQIFSVNMWPSSSGSKNIPSKKQA